MAVNIESPTTGLKSMGCLTIELWTSVAVFSIMASSQSCPSTRNTGSGGIETPGLPAFTSRFRVIVICADTQTEREYNASSSVPVLFVSTLMAMGAYFKGRCAVCVIVLICASFSALLTGSDSFSTIAKSAFFESPFVSAVVSGTASGRICAVVLDYLLSTVDTKRWQWLTC